ncbi:helix-turn-helix domain-containing protein [Aromatoleum toluclasticum]|uniref:helix-turn-helix domain-containing protein n=1 Tax=Aromatoleum toluclasticum TaxID=92003 RepID=UPI0003760EEA|nr:helix-turn-helix domain-containing protein [Aromatoleum toluclasticum]
MLTTLNRRAVDGAQSPDTETIDFVEVVVGASHNAPTAPVSADRAAPCLTNAAAVQADFPRANSVKGAVLAELLAGIRMTHKDVWERHGSSRAAHHIFKLRAAGWSIERNDIDAPTSDSRVARIAEYFMLPETIHAAGAAGQQYVAEVRRVRGLA